MNFADIFYFLYPIAPIIAMIGFFPQIVALYRCSNGAKTISISTWIVWAGTWGISLGYAIFYLGDTMFAATCIMNLVFHTCIIVLACKKRIGKLSADFAFSTKKSRFALSRSEDTQLSLF